MNSVTLNDSKVFYVFKDRQGKTFSLNPDLIEENIDKCYEYVRTDIIVDGTRIIIDDNNIIDIWINQNGEKVFFRPFWYPSEGIPSKDNMKFEYLKTELMKEV